jgi:thiamine biosynthesis lipoprotein
VIGICGGVRHVEQVMGTAVSIDIRGAYPGDDALADVLAWLHHVDETFSTYRPESEISRFGRRELAVGDLTSETRRVLARCLELRSITDGAFDIAAVPAPNGTHLDPSGYVKGWAIERAAAMLEAAGAHVLCINAGGDVAVRGCPPGTPGWRVGIRHPSLPSLLARVVTVTGPAGVATSATYERGAHIIDPRLGAPTTSIASATVVGPDLGTADAYATALFVMGVDGLDWIEERDGYDGYVITHDDTTHWTTGFPADAGRAIPGADPAASPNPPNPPEEGPP